MLFKALLITTVMMTNGELHILTKPLDMDKCPTPDIVQKSADIAFANVFNVLKVKSICLDPSTSA